MAAATQPPARQLSRLQIPPPVGQPQPFVYGDNAPVFSPSLPTAINVGAHHTFPAPPHQFPLQTPMQTQFFPRQPPGAPLRPGPGMHRAHPSIVQLAAAGILPPQGMPVTPLGQARFPNPMVPPSPLPPPFVPRSKRTQSVATGGPPKAVLGGPQGKVIAKPVVVAAAAPQPKVKKVIVSLPKETVQEGEQKGSRQQWARTPLPLSEVVKHGEMPPPELVSAEPFPSDAWRKTIPVTVDVFLPGKPAWKIVKQKMIEEKLEKLGVEKGSGSSVPHIHAPHARAASISSPADPALLYFKLNKLQQSQNAPGSGPIAVSPQLPAGTSSSPGGSVPPRFQNRHGHSLSLAHSGTLYNPSAAFNPFGPSATLGSDQIFQRSSPGAPGITANAESAPLHAPQGRVPANVNSLAVPAPLSRPESRPDFSRGFGLDVTEEEEEPPEEEQRDEGELTDALADATETTDEDPLADGTTTAAQSRIHSRHVSKLSAALSLCSVGRNEEQVILNSSTPPMATLKEPEGEQEVLDTDAVEEWTGSEDMKETSDDEVCPPYSIGEWSNPSDEERARQDRLHRRMLRRARRIHRDLEAPRRIPNFPRPPETFLPISSRSDDDVISNPSDEDRRQYLGYSRPQEFIQPTSSHSSSKGRPLPPLPHSRTNSAHFSYHDPALAHSREASNSLKQGGVLSHPASNQSPTPASNVLRTESLNPLAKPFVFDIKPTSSTVAPASAPAPAAPAATHVRGPSFSKPLNVAAPEFKPGGFTFKPPPGVPQLSFPQPAPRPLPTPPIVSTEPRATQGREKRQRRGSHGSFADDESADDANDTMSSFRFPPPADDAKVLRHSAPASPPASAGPLNINAKPLTFSGFSSALHFTQDDSVLPAPLVAQGDALDSGPVAESMQKPDHAEPEAATELPFPPQAKPKRAPIPLDFKHPVSTNTVPAGLFKSVINADNDERTRRQVRSRLSSRDIFEHSPRPSLDDLAVPAIAKRPNRRMLTDPGAWDPAEEGGDEEIYSPRLLRRSSAPTRRGSMSESEVSFGPINVSRTIELRRYEQRLEALLEEKIGSIKKALEERNASDVPQALPSEAIVAEAIAALRKQLQESAIAFRPLPKNDGDADARGDFDFEMLRDIVLQSQAESRNAIQRDLEELFTARSPANDFRKFAEELSERTMKAIMTATSQVTMQMHTVEKSRGSFAAERENLIRDMLAAFTPHLTAVRHDPIDYDVLTEQLSQAVKPHISQLIDLASDKRETAGLIVDSLVPMLSKMYPPQQFDADTVVSRLSNEVRSIVSGLDAHEIKEQVSDLVVARLESRLAVRDRHFSADAVADRVKESVRGLLLPLNTIQSSLDSLNAETPQAILDASNVQQAVSSALADLPAQLRAVVEAFGEVRAQLKSQPDRQIRDAASAGDMQQVLESIEDVLDEQKRLVSQNNEFSDFCQDILKHINELPEAIVEATKVLQNAHSDMLSRDTSQKDAEEIRHLVSVNAELQVQLAKARGSHGQVRVEKDALADRMQAVEIERDSFRAKLEVAESSSAAKADEVRAAEARAVELGTVLSQALERVKSFDDASQSNQDRILLLETTVADLTHEKEQLMSQVGKLEMNASFAGREKDFLTQELSALRKRNEELATQQLQWDELRRTSEHMQNLAAVIGRADDEEMQELKHIRDNYKSLEADYTALQRRFKDQEVKTANNERTAQAARQSLSQAQQRAIEWEKRAKEYEQELDSARSRLSEVEQVQSQLDADYSVLKLQMEERDAEERLAKDRESKLRDQTASLEAQLARARAETASKPINGTSTHAPIPSRVRQNGYTRASHTHARPDSRASTVYGDSRVVTPAAQHNGSHYAPNIQAVSPQQSVWDSIHAPTARQPMTPKAVRPHSYYRPQIPSPTPSTVSAAPTLGDDGWWQ
ncbi:uncharacterized protein PHACADRAFT_82113 [Phanerochaete carnosa HHB-10118-sp]|uniref:Uncharacterized protein n=1 Tax=Phanerochaete carnosa (strain HHB-10118-sp) TaxID=650164 RepID=K5XBQ5_PHACS|nr:uncharacterized protein PHACADRAFT_82113 [Phanerochaete carnosa HHB-10118-sp]EKM60392.1 hypothetical protein PHACADRAFT_82113 [Phanerochaete carnosa HHB-10118-sp]